MLKHRNLKILKMHLNFQIFNKKISKTYKRFDEGGMSVLDHKRKACVITEG